MSQADRQRLGLVEGTVVDGRYRIEAELGRGGFARVYKAAHLDLGRGAALKVIELPQQPGAVDIFIERFLREARIAANLSHPNIVTVYDYGVVGQSGQPYLAMELLEGWDLEMVLAHHGPMAPSRAIGLMIEVLDALATSQGKGIVHKDLKPSNLFVVGEGTPRERLVLIDFGIARIWDDSESRITQTGGFTGTPAYFAPEYVENQIVTPAIDVYQCGLILIEMMTGIPAVVAETAMQYLLKHCAGEVDVPEVLQTSPLGPILLKALAVNHEERYANCAEFRDALESIDASAVPAPSRRSEGPVVRHSTLESPPQTSDFEVSIGSSDTLAPSAESPAAISDDVKPPTRPGVAAAIVTLVVVLGGVAIIASNPEPPEVPPRAMPAAVPGLTVATAEVEEPPAEPPAVAPARISSEPEGASISIDGVVHGETPIVIGGDLLLGESHVIRVSRPGYDPEERRVVLEPGGVLNFELRAKPRVMKPTTSSARTAAKPPDTKPKSVPAALAP